MSSPHRATSRRSDLDIAKAQVRAIDAWNRAHDLRESAAHAANMSREMQLDLSRRMEARRREQAAIVTRTDAQLRTSGRALAAAPRLRAIVAHRHEWMTQRICELLAEGNVQVVGTFIDGADAAGTVVAEQPDLVIVQDRLPTLTGVEVVREVRQYSPGSVVAAQAQDSTGVPGLVDAGAHAVFTRRVSPVDIVDRVLACVRGEVDTQMGTLTLV